jgi:hypothetical protein
MWYCINVALHHCGIASNVVRWTRRRCVYVWLMLVCCLVVFPQALYFSFGKVTTASYGSSTTTQRSSHHSSQHGGQHNRPKEEENAHIQTITQERKWAGEHKNDRQIVVAVPVAVDPPPTRHAWSSNALPASSHEKCSSKNQVSWFRGWFHGWFHGWCLVGSWLGHGWFMVGSWLVHGCGTALHALTIGYEECEVGEVGVN